MTYFAILTVQRTINGLTESRTAKGPITPPAGATREEVLAVMRAELPAEFRTKGSVLHFYCEPNQLGGA